MFIYLKLTLFILVSFNFCKIIYLFIQQSSFKLTLTTFALLKLFYLFCNVYLFEINFVEF